ncbi:MAG: hypothetical protein JXK16_07545, partial [Thiotrichales bacterium]|nr:hypothetical protein [Thiotrichales bacterium]
MPICNPLLPKFGFGHRNTPVIENAQKNNELHQRILDVEKLPVTNLLSHCIPQVCHCERSEAIHYQLYLYGLPRPKGLAMTKG